MVAFNQKLMVHCSRYTKSADRGCVDAINNLAQLQFEVARTAEEFQFAIELFRVAANGSLLLR